MSFLGRFKPNPTTISHISLFLCLMYNPVILSKALLGFYFTLCCGEINAVAVEISPRKCDCKYNKLFPCVLEWPFLCGFRWN